MNKSKPQEWVTRTLELALVLLILLYAYGIPLPDQGEILSTVIENPPRQEDITAGGSFSKDYINFTYLFAPLATYEITGLIVSLRQSDSAIDISHEFDPANTTDVCIVWGKNITSGAYREVSYDHGDYTCNYRWKGEFAPDFHGELISNSHLIPQDHITFQQLKSLQVGDQIRMSGTLVDYEVTQKDGTKVGHRRTSLTRTDAGNGASEIILLSRVELLSRNMPWRIPILNVLFVIIFSCVAYLLFSVLPKHREPIGEVTEEPHIQNPFEAQNFLKKKNWQQKNSSVDQDKGSVVR